MSLLKSWTTLALIVFVIMQWLLAAQLEDQLTKNLLGFALWVAFLPLLLYLERRRSKSDD